VALGAGIHSAGAATVQACTTLDQALLRGEVLTSAGPSQPLPPSNYSFAAANVSWLYHNTVVYVVAAADAGTSSESHDTLELSNGPQYGSWSSINAPESNDTVEEAVFHARWCHGVSPAGAGYAYAVLPAVAAGDAAAAAADFSQRMRVFANSASAQAAMVDGGRNPWSGASTVVVHVVLWQAGSSVACDSSCAWPLTLSASAPVIITLVRNVTTSGPRGDDATTLGPLRVAVASLDKSSGVVTVKLSGAFASAGSGAVTCEPSGGATVITADLPAAPYAGASVVGVCDASG
jgi:hypothetical protein